MSDLDDELAKQQATKVKSSHLAAETIGEINPAHTGAENDVLLRQQNIELINRELAPGEVPPRSRAKVLKPQLANNPAVLVTGAPNPRGIPSNATLVDGSYYQSPDGKVISK